MSVDGADVGCDCDRNETYDLQTLLSCGSEMCMKSRSEGMGFVVGAVVWMG